ncbi:MAG TPA: hypothetical protein VJN18_21550 [Polyangiaceae bacterium]|nr:hypothetical protein [Polyangiaceae bacterium]
MDVIADVNARQAAAEIAWESLDFTIGYFPSPSDLILLTSLALF